MPSFNLVDEPWIPCVREGGAQVELGIRDTLIEAHKLREISDSSPLVVVALHRLLLALLHRVFGPASPEAWHALWTRGEFDGSGTDSYCARWRERFDLFDAARPFLQTAGLESDYAVPVAVLAHEIDPAYARWFEHTGEDADLSLPPGRAARWLLSLQAFSMGGLVSLRKGENPKTCKSADAGPLVKAAVVLVRGATLFETLLLNLHQYSPEDESPCPSSADDAPAWERTSETRAEDRVPLGYLDWLTWPSRRIRLLPRADTGSGLQVSAAVRMKGNQLPDSHHRRTFETMVPFRRKADAKEREDPWPALVLREQRALWRDSLALCQSIADVQARPRTLTWLERLAELGSIERAWAVPLDVFGLCSDRATIQLWRQERLTLPLAYLRTENVDLIGDLATALNLAEEVGRVVDRCAYSLSRLLLAPGAGQSGGRDPRQEDVRPVREHLALGRSFWERVDRRFRTLLVELPADAVEDAQGVVEYGRRVLPEWATALREAARQAFRDAAHDLDTSSRSLKAVAIAEAQLEAELGRLLEPFKRTEEVNS